MYPNVKLQSRLGYRIHKWVRRTCPIELSTRYPHLQKKCTLDQIPMICITCRGLAQQIETCKPCCFNDFHDLPKPSRPCLSIYTLCPPRPFLPRSGGSIVRVRCTSVVPKIIHRDLATRLKITVVFLTEGGIQSDTCAKGRYKYTQTDLYTIHVCLYRKGNI